MWTKNRYLSLYTLFLIVFAFSFLTRTILLVKSLSSLELTPLLLAKIYGVGFFFDCVTFSYFAIPFVIVAMLLPDKVFNSTIFKALAGLVGFVVTYLMLFNVIAEYTFFDEFATRYNFIAIDYLIYTTEVIRNIRESYPVNWLLGGILLVNIFVFIFVRKHLTTAFSGTSRLGQRCKTGFLFLLLPILSFFFVDISMNHISPNNYADELASNGIYNLAAAFRNNELDFNKFYTVKENDVVMSALKRQLTEKGNHFVSSDTNEISRVIQHQGTERHLNVVVVIEESLSASFLGTFGNSTGITPNLDKLADESMFFTNLYATGTRTVRGLEAITLAMPPLPGTSIVKRPHNENFFSWGSVMKDKGYDNKFIYAGHGYFDNMNYFFANNGFATVDRLNFAKDEVTFTNAWGVCDEDLFMKAIKEGDASFAKKKPFFSVVMTTSNHRPYTYPDGKIDIPSKTGRDGGVKYADFAIGRLLAEAKKKPWFNDTIFVIVADHCAGSARKMALPVKDYRIPLFIYAPALIKPQKIDRMMSQIDIAPTVLGLLNLSYTTKFFGKDILNDQVGQERAFISTYQKLGFIEGNRLLVLGPKKETGFYTFTKGFSGDDKTTEIKPQDDLLVNGLGYYQGAYYVYKNRLNRLVK
ncbi:sn-glycerol-1-phosphate transferase, putative [Geotalea daltonii FRC-32]|uniref:sn-glycerol-1-phosphate transferase, putative n=1 Tax=Geotalea daltonii (strain DSM 22248 / JCM 15807 / FRC-32) TaxID=316067 RepID=B9M6D8_GEODF|nr:LTA synthase family protein [Geotalea daltonii]ACM21926.1 sn-glycerol-1-phosphate transferase, putative [Geotalea daltonii FRC-32]